MTTLPEPKPAQPATPQWAVDPQTPIPLGFLPADGLRPDRFWLGIQPRAVVLLDEEWRTLPTEELVNLAAGAWKAASKLEPERKMAELVARGWLAAVATEQNRNLSRLIIPSNSVH